MTRTKISLLGALAVSTLSLAGCNRDGEFSPVDMWNRSRYKPLEPIALGTPTVGTGGQGMGPSSSRHLPAGTVYRGQIERDKLYPASENGMSVRRMQETGILRDEPNTPAQPGSEAYPGSTGAPGNRNTRSVTSGGNTGSGSAGMSGANMGATGDYRIRGGGATMTSFPFPVTKVVLDRGKERYEIYCAPCHGKTGAGDGMIVRRGFSQPPTYHQDRLREAPVGHYFDVITNGFGAMYPYASKVSPEDRWAITAYIRALQLSQNATSADVAAAKSMGGGAKAPTGSTSGDTTFDSSPTRPDTEHLSDPATAN